MVYIPIKIANFMQMAENGLKSQVFEKIFAEKFGSKEKMRTFAIPFGKYAEIAQLVEHNLAKVRVASSSLVFRSKTGHLRMTLNFEITRRGSIYVSRPCAQGTAFLLIRNYVTPRFEIF